MKGRESTTPPKTVSLAPWLKGKIVNPHQLHSYKAKMSPTFCICFEIFQVPLC